MFTFPAWIIDASQILTRGELARVLADLSARAPRLPNVHMNLAIVRLACCCGLRASEIGGLRLGDVDSHSPGQTRRAAPLGRTSLPGVRGRRADRDRRGLRAGRRHAGQTWAAEPV